MIVENRLCLQRLSSWLNVVSRTSRILYRRPLAEQAASILSLCEASGIIAFQGLALEVTCRECDDPHVAQILYQGVSYHYLCPMNGVISLTEDDLKLVRCDKKALLRALSASAGLKENAARVLNDGSLVYLGLTAQDRGNQPWGLAYAEGLEDPNILAGVIENIQQRFCDGPGLIVTPSRVALTLPLPRSYKLIALHELFFGESDRITLDLQMARTRLGRREKVPRTPGRPTKRETTRRLQAELKSAGDWPASASLQVRLIQAQWPQEDWPPPAPNTLENQLRRLNKK